MDTAEFVNVDSNNKAHFFLKALCQQKEKGSKLGLAFREAAKINEILKN